MSRNAQRKERQRLKRKQKKMAIRRFQSRTPLQRIAAEGGSLECWISPDFREEGIAAIQVAGHDLSGRCAVAGFLIDLWCVGFKDAFGRSEVDEAAFREQSLEPWMQRMGSSRVDAGKVRRLVAGSIRFSRQNGFRLPPQWEKWVTIFGRDILHELATADVSDFGIDGGLRYVGSMDFLRRRLIGCSVEEFVSRPDVQVVLDADSLDEWDVEDLDEDEEDFDEDEDDLDEEPAEAPDALEQLTERVTSAVRKWCFAKSLTPHPRLREGVAIALAAANAYGAGDPSGEQVDPAEALRIGQELLERYSPTERQEVLAAIAQAKQFIMQFDDPERMLQAVEIEKSHEGPTP